MVNKQKAKPVVNLAELNKLAGLFSASEFVELLENKRKFAWLNFKAGVYRGIGGVVGVALTIVVIGYLVYLLGGIPIIGNFIRDIQTNVPVKTPL